ncbi:MAG: hypothetical protein FJZ87_12445 [Chloroflexi bacterium]|nr:hypothetical protein [Chloroflexota bacterium]
MIRKILLLIRPVQLILAALAYLLGAGIANYLGIPLVADSFWLGLLMCLLGQSSMSMLAEAFRPFLDPILADETRTERTRLRALLINLSLGFLGAEVILGYILFANSHLPSSAIFFLLISLVFIIAYAIPPIRALNRGYGELILAAHIAYIITGLGFLLQSEEFHRLLFGIAMPLTTLALAYFLVLGFPSFSRDQKYQRGTMLRLLTWQRTIPLHHSLVISSYILFLAASAMGPSLNLLWPAFLTFPFACLQIAMLWNIARGAKPNWKLLTSTALGVLGLTMYFLTLTFWLR